MHVEVIDFKGVSREERGRDSGQRVRIPGPPPSFSSFYASGQEKHAFVALNRSFDTEFVASKCTINDVRQIISVCYCYMRGHYES